MPRLAKGILCLMVCAAFCAADSSAKQAARRGQKAERAGDFLAAYEAYAEAARQDPRSYEYVMRREVTRQKAVFRIVWEGQRLMDQGKYAAAVERFTKAAEIDPSNDFARVQKKEAESHLPQPPSPPAETSALPEETTLVALSPRQTRRAWDLRGDTKALYLALGAAYGINFLFDDDVPALTAHLVLEEVDLSQALSATGIITKTFAAPIDEHTAIVAMDNSVKRLQYERQVLRNLDVSALETPDAINEVGNILRTVLEPMRWVVVNVPRKVISVRDEIGKVMTAEALVRSLCHGKPEVLIEVQSIEIDSNMARTLGLLPTLQYQLTPLPSATRLLTMLATGTFGITLPSASFAATLSKTFTRNLSDVQFRAVDGAPATFLIGARYPIVSATFSAVALSGSALQQQQAGTLVNPFPSFTFEDIGIKIKATPRIHADNDVSLALEVQTRALEGQSASGLPPLSNREYNTQMRVHDGQTVALSGIMTSQEQRSLNGLAGLSAIPGLGLLFGQQTKQRSDSEVILLITPHILQLGAAQIEPGGIIPAPRDYVPVWR